MKTIKNAFRLNVLIFILELFSVIWMMSGTGGGILSSVSLSYFKFFTVDSNILLGITAVIAAIDEKRVLSGKKSSISEYTYITKLVGTVGVTLTMIVTIFFLAPTSAAAIGWFGLFYYNNFLMHLLNPVLAIVTFLFYEQTDSISFKHTFTGIIPMLIYAVYYVSIAFTHSSNGKISEGYDWYGFFVLGTASAVIVVPLFILLTYGISFLLWRLNRHKFKKADRRLSGRERV